MGHDGCDGAGSRADAILNGWRDGTTQMGRSKAEAGRAETDPMFEEAKREIRPLEIRCQGCRKTQREVLAIVEINGFVFCSECIETAASIVSER